MTSRILSFFSLKVPNPGLQVSQILDPEKPVAFILVNLNSLASSNVYNVNFLARLLLETNRQWQYEE